MRALLRSMGHALQGIRQAVQTERNLRIELAAAVLVAALGWLLQISRTEWLAVLLCVALVIMAELFNTAVEDLADRVSPAEDDRIRRIKDMVAGAVLVMAAGAAGVGLLIFLPRIWVWLF